MTDDTILSLFDDVADVLSYLQQELSCITTSDTGSDPTSHIQREVKRLRDRIAAPTTRRTSTPKPRRLSTPTKKE
jgi:hypothetical protein